MEGCKRDKLLRSLGTQLTIAGNTDQFWEAKLKAILKRLNNWRTLSPTLIEKNMVAKLSLYSCIWYYCQNMHVPHKFKVDLNRIIDTFLHKNYKGYQPIDKKSRDGQEEVSMSDSFSAY